MTDQSIHLHTSTGTKAMNAVNALIMGPPGGGKGTIAKVKIDSR